MTREVTEGPVYFGEAPVGPFFEVDQGDAYRRVLEGAPEASIRLGASAFDVGHLGDVLADAHHPHQLLSRWIEDRLAPAADVPDLAVRPDDAVLEPKGGDTAEVVFDLLADLDLLVGMDALEVRGEGHSKGMRVFLPLDPEDPIELVGPKDLVLARLPFPAAGVGDSLRV